MIVLFALDRAFRTSVDRALRTAGVAVRAASRQAELAKALNDGASHLLIVGPTADDRAMAEAVCASLTPGAVAALTLLSTKPGDTIEEIVRRALSEAVLPGGDPD